MLLIMLASSIAFGCAQKKPEPTPIVLPVKPQVITCWINAPLNMLDCKQLDGEYKLQAVFESDKYTCHDPEAWAAILKYVVELEGEVKKCKR